MCVWGFQLNMLCLLNIDNAYRFNSVLFYRSFMGNGCICCKLLSGAGINLKGKDLIFIFAKFLFM